MKKSYLSKNLIISMMAASASLLSFEAMASGYSIRETSTSLLGNSYAGSSTSDEDISSMHYNPATLSMIEDSSVYFSGTGIFPDIKAHNITGEASSFPSPAPISGSNSASNIGKDAFIPAGYFAWNVDEEWKLGLAITSPWGLSTGYDNDWKGRYHGVDTKLETVNINPIVSFSVNEQLSLAAGFQAQYVNAQLKQYGYQELVFVPPEGLPIVGHAESPARVAGNDWGYGYNLGVLYEFTEHTRLGIGYQSKISHTIEGDASVNTAVFLPPGFPTTGPAFNSDASAQITTPEQVNLGLSHDINKHWTIMGDVQWTRWDRFQELDVEIEAPTGEIHSVTEEQWENTWFYALGADYKPNKKWVFRGGAAYDQSPVDDQFRNPTIPDSNRVLLSAGAGYNFTDDLRLDVGYMYVFFQDATVDLELDPTDPTSTSLNADYEGNANIVSVGLNWLF
jgi:long-chain fatty acid transport protein